MKTASAKAKGRRLCAEIKELLYKYAPDLRPGDIEVTSSGVTGADLKFSPAAQAKYALSIECKCQEALNIWAALKQAERHGEKATAWVAPAVFFRRNNSKPYVALSAEDFIKLVVTR